MASYYEVLGIPETADAATIRAAYKRLAMKYHPDRNPGNADAEEKFKAVNEAYHVLSDSLKRARYDSRFEMYTNPRPTPSYYDVQRARYEQWRKIQQQRYRFDKQYFRIQGLAFLVFLIIAGFCFGVIHTIDYVVAQHYEEIRRQNTELLHQVDKLFEQGKVDEAFETISLLRTKDPLEFRFLFAYDSLVNVLRNRGDRNYENQQFQTAGHLYNLLRKYEVPLRTETLQRIAKCEYENGEFEKSLTSLKELYEKTPWDYNLVYEIARIEQENFHHPEEALRYYDQGKRLFKENMSRRYGEAFQVVMNPADAPPIYFDIFMGRGKVNMELAQYEEALTDFNFATWLRPDQAEGFRQRAYARAKARRYQHICEDIRQAERLGATGMENLTAQYCR